MPLALDSIKLITFDNLDAFIDELITDEWCAHEFV